MKGLLCLFTFFVLAFVPSQAGVSVSVHTGGSGGFSGGGHSGGFHGSRGGFYGGYPFYSYPYDSFYAPFDYDDDTSFYAPDYAFAPAPPTNPTMPTGAPPPSTPASPAPASSQPIPTGKLDKSGYIHSPFSTATFKVEKVINGQLFHDPITGQLFQIRLIPAPKGSAPSGSMPTGKLDEFGYVHSPYSTYMFKVKDGNYAQTFRDPYTNQPFNVTASEATVTPAPSASVPTGKLDEFGYVHSPYSTFIFKVRDGNYAKTFYDPFTSQPFNVNVSGATETVASAKATN
jgi:hypothetical protein